MPFEPCVSLAHPEGQRDKAGHPATPSVRLVLCGDPPPFSLLELCWGCFLPTRGCGEWSLDLTLDQGTAALGTGTSLFTGFWKVIRVPGLSSVQAASWASGVAPWRDTCRARTWGSVWTFLSSFGPRQAWSEIQWANAVYSVPILHLVFFPTVSRDALAAGPRLRVGP